MKKITLEEFRQKAFLTHNDKYDYTDVLLTCVHDKITIKCKEHGTFLQTPNNHLRGQGCPYCAGVNKSNTDKFIQKATMLHGDKYDYSKVIYTNAKTKVCIICQVHGEFWQTPNKHLSKRGCPKCKIDKIIKINSSTQQLVIKKFIEIHGNKYNYSNVIYLGNHLKICIVCPIHGEFWQTPGSHIQGCGCPNCQASKGEQTLKAIFDKYKLLYETQYNIPEIVNNYKIDFYLHEYRLLIEFHGIQHYKYIPFFHDGDYTFEVQKTRDDLVRDAAIRWKYNYLEFNYKQLKHMTKEQFEEMVINKIR